MCLIRHVFGPLGDRLSDEEFEQVVLGMEDGQGIINYESEYHARPNYP